MRRATIDAQTAKSKPLAASPGVHAQVLAEELAVAYRDEQAILDELGAKAHKAAVQVGVASIGLTDELLHARGPEQVAMAEAVVEVLKDNEVDTGNLSSRLVDTLSKILHRRLYPAPWSTSRSKWAVVEH